MKKSSLLILCSLSILLLLTFSIGVPPAWSAPGNKKQPLQNSANKNVVDRDVKDGKNPKKSAKKRVVKKAGTAVAVGVIGNKVKSNVKEGIKD